MTATLSSPMYVSLYIVAIFSLLKSLLQTDGFSDNVFPSEMMTICSLVARGGRTEDEQVQDMADRMVEYSRLCMKSKTRVSPFESTSILSLPFHVLLLHRAPKLDAVLILICHFQGKLLERACISEEGCDV